MVDREEIVVVSASEGVNTRGKTRTTSKKKDQAGANAAIRLLETCQKLVQSQQSKGKTKTISIDRSLFEELINRVKQCEKITEDSLSFDSITVKQYLETFETNLVERINSSVTNKLSVAFENAQVGTEERLAATVEKSI
ncbi:uncharacterized protein PV09_09703 [Verruconis gallopava]|uniref:Uncharacterized protein n=1 Tax=Verruconis gallopava TaxID=253628 RepID=A0A0D1YCU8_9PEZI|nr:uncharacterized protein PV09_09703 [Verruconis gallopava]KIV98486.1 hypothetical protein PV09_09703 [Verruconis gallopava]